MSQDKTKDKKFSLTIKILIGCAIVYSLCTAVQTGLSLYEQHLINSGPLRLPLNGNHKQELQIIKKDDPILYKQMLTEFKTHPGCEGYMFSSYVLKFNEYEAGDL